ncbi:hypothetical protein [Pedobacter nototheniae]|uniref:hypothetical protein n=1 Tax=Pedobacter nototheniae TaxID=2488994 RepID=UPI0029311550|nr:hypothetical protein [Pedobacter nototheniae]
MKYYFLFYILFYSFSASCQSTPKANHNPKAVALNNKAFKLLINGTEINLSDEQRSKKALRILDSATTIDSKYNSAYLNKLSSLLYLRKYKLAIETVDKVIKNGQSPFLFRAYLSGGIIQKDYLKQNESASKYFDKAYKSAINKAELDKHKTVNYDTTVSLVLYYSKGKEEAIIYLNKITPLYKNQKAVTELNAFKTMIANGNVHNDDFFKNFSTY